MLKEALNKVFVDGILSENKLEQTSYQKDGKTVDCIRGTFTIKTHHGDTTLEIPVKVFVNKLTKDGRPNSSYQSLEKIITEYKSIAACGGEQDATALRVSGAKLKSNDYINKNGDLQSYPEITASFVKPIRKDEVKLNNFDIELVVANKTMEVDKEGNETGRLKIKAIVPQYGGNVDVMDFFVISPEGIDYIEQNWQDNDTVHAKGWLNFSSTSMAELMPMAFGPPTEKTKTTSISEMIIESGDFPYEGEFAYDFDAVAEAMKDRKIRLDALKNKPKTASTKKTLTAAPQRRLDDLGF